MNLRVVVGLDNKIINLKLKLSILEVDIFRRIWQLSLTYWVLKLVCWGHRIQIWEYFLLHEKSGYEITISKISFYRWRILQGVQKRRIKIKGLHNQLVWYWVLDNPRNSRLICCCSCRQLSIYTPTSNFSRKHLKLRKIMTDWA